VTLWTCLELRILFIADISYQKKIPQNQQRYLH